MKPVESRAAELDAIAVVGMAGRFPGAPDVDAYWRNLRDGVESVVTLSDESLAAVGLTPQQISDPALVKAGAPLGDVDLFDAGLFKITGAEARLMDPQHRLLLQCVWHALEDAAIQPLGYPGLIGIFAGCSVNTYALSNVLAEADLLTRVGGLQGIIANDKDFLATRAAYVFDLRGPAVTVQSACSTSLVAVHFAVQSLLSGECDVALAGGASVSVPEGAGYHYEAGGIQSRDGHCRPFDAAAQGTLRGNGVGVVVLERLADALEQGDPIRAVIRGSAINNDGRAKVSFTASAVAGQATVVANALEEADLGADSISLVECHGTGTALGDPVEVEALCRAFREDTEDVEFCALGSVKANIGHLDAAAGIASLIKVVSALENEEIPPQINLETVNPQIPLAGSPFYIPLQPVPWPRTAEPRRAGVTALGVGGTNVHLIVEEAPRVEPLPPPPRDWYLLPFSAASDGALHRLGNRLAEALEGAPQTSLPAVSCTLQMGRQRLSHRRWVVCRTAEEAVAQLRQGAVTRVEPQSEAAQQAIFLFPGQGAQHPAMGMGLYGVETVFTEVLDQCWDLLTPHLEEDPRQLFSPRPGAREAAKLRQTAYAQPALFAVEYALARQLMAWGLKPAAMVGHSIGEFVAACLAEVMELADALAIVAARGRLMQSQPGGAMLGVALGEQELLELLPAGLGVAAVNAADQCVVSGTVKGIEDFASSLRARQVVCRHLHTSHAFHSPRMEGAVAPFVEVVAARRLGPPKIPFVSCVTGTWISDSQAVDPEYWGEHLLQPVLFAAALETLGEVDAASWIEVGPGRTLRQLAGAARQSPVITTMPSPDGDGEDVACLLNALGQLWAEGQVIDWLELWGGQPPRRISLPLYPFAKRSFWLGRPTTIRSRDRERVEPLSMVPEVTQPRDPLERQLVDLWAGLLGMPSIGIDEDFYTLDGQSLMAVKMMMEIHQRWRVELPPSILFTARTVEQLARVIRTRQQKAADSGLVPIRTEGSGAPLFAVHPASGNVLCYLELARRLGSERPFYGLEAPGIYRLADPSREQEKAAYFELEIPAMAARYLAAVRSVQPAGPYLLTGWSFGGILAFEMAQQLRRQGEEVEALILIDAPAPFAKPKDFSSARIVAGAAREVGRFYGKEFLVPFEDLQARDRQGQVELILARAQAEGVAADGMGLAQIQRFINFIAEGLESVWKYDPRPYDGALTLLRAQDLAAENQLLAGHPHYDQPSYGWHRLVEGRLDVRVVPGDHFSLPFPPDVEHLAGEIRALLNKEIRATPNPGNPT